MNQVFKVEIAVEKATADARKDTRRLEAVGRLIDRLVRPGRDAADPLIAIFRQTAAEAKAAGLTEAEIDAELALHKVERSC